MASAADRARDRREARGRTRRSSSGSSDREHDHSKHDHGSSGGSSSSNPNKYKYEYGGISYEDKADATAASRADGGASSSRTDHLEKQNSGGLTTSDSADNAVNEANDTLDNIESTPGSTGNGVQEQLASLFEQISSAREQLVTAKENEKIAKDKSDNADLQAQLGGEGDLADGINAINNVAAGGEADSSAVDDPVLRAMTDSTINKITLAQAQQTRLNDFAETMSQYAQADINDISATAARAVERQVAENDRVQRAMRGAGILAGRSQIAPTVQGSIINEIIEDGLDRINVIEEKKTSAVRTARKAETEFNYALFTDSVEIAKQLNTDIENSVTNLKAQVRQAEKDEQDAITFRQEQEERNSLILAGELVGATPEVIQQTALANGIDPGLLAKAVNDAKFEASNREFTESNNALTLANKRQDLIKKRTPAAPKAVVIPDDIEQNFRSGGFSSPDTKAIYSDIQDLGIDGMVETYLEEGQIDREEIKAIVSAHEKSQRAKAATGHDTEPTNAEIKLNAFIDTGFDQKISLKNFTATVPKFRGDKGSSAVSFFKPE